MCASSFSTAHQNSHKSQSGQHLALVLPVFAFFEFINPFRMFAGYFLDVFLGGLGGFEATLIASSGFVRTRRPSEHLPSSSHERPPEHNLSWTAIILSRSNRPDRCNGLVLAAPGDATE
jgi:hypothetical protein